MKCMNHMLRSQKRRVQPVVSPLSSVRRDIMEVQHGPPRGRARSRVPPSRFNPFPAVLDNGPRARHCEGREEWAANREEVGGVGVPWRAPL